MDAHAALPPSVFYTGVSCHCSSSRSLIDDSSLSVSLAAANAFLYFPHDEPRLQSLWRDMYSQMEYELINESFKDIAAASTASSFSLFSSLDPGRDFHHGPTDYKALLAKFLAFNTIGSHHMVFSLSPALARTANAGQWRRLFIELAGKINEKRGIKQEKAKIFVRVSEQEDDKWKTGELESLIASLGAPSVDGGDDAFGRPITLLDCYHSPHIDLYSRSPSILPMLRGIFLTVDHAFVGSQYMLIKSFRQFIQTNQGAILEEHDKRKGALGSAMKAKPVKVSSLFDSDSDPAPAPLTQPTRTHAVAAASGRPGPAALRVYISEWHEYLYDQHCAYMENIRLNGPPSLTHSNAAMQALTEAPQTAMRNYSEAAGPMMAPPVMNGPSPSAANNNSIKPIEFPLSIDDLYCLYYLFARHPLSERLQPLAVADQGKINYKTRQCVRAAIENGQPSEWEAFLSLIKGLRDRLYCLHGPARDLYYLLNSPLQRLAELFHDLTAGPSAPTRPRDWMDDFVEAKERRINQRAGIKAKL